MRFSITLTPLVIPIFIGNLPVGSGKGSFQEDSVADQMPVAVLIKLSTGRGQGRRPNSSPFLVLFEAVFMKTSGKIDILDGDEVRVESSDGLDTKIRVFTATKISHEICGPAQFCW